MKVIRQYKVIGQYNYDRIIHNIEKNYAKRQDIGQTNGKMHLDKNKNLCNSLKLTLLLFKNNALVTSCKSYTG